MVAGREMPRRRWRKGDAMEAGFPDELLRIAVEVARQVAGTAARMRAEGVSAVATKSTATDVVTAADRAVEQEIIDTLARLRPQDTVLGEEYGATGPTSP